MLRVYNGIGKNRILMNAAGVTSFYALLALFPADYDLCFNIRAFAAATIVNALVVLAGVLPGGGMVVIQEASPGWSRSLAVR